MSEREKTPEERGRESAEAFLSGAEQVVGESLKSVWSLSKLGCFAYVVYFVLACVVAAVVFGLADLFAVIPPWLVVVGFVVALVIYYSRKKPEPPRT